MKILFDHGTPAPLRRHLPEHSVDTLAEKGWSEKDNGELLELAERAGYEVLVTIDQSLRHQQNLAGRRIGIVVLIATVWAVRALSNEGDSRSHPRGRARSGSGSLDLSGEHES